MTASRPAEISSSTCVGRNPAGAPPEGRKLRNGLIGLAIFCGLVAALLLGVPSLHSVAHRIAHADRGWVVAGVGFELLSCAGYGVLFGLVFPRLGRRLDALLSLSELAVNAVVSAGGAGGLALGVWVLRSKGLPVADILRRSVLLFVLTSAVNVGAVMAIGFPMWLGLLPGSRNPLLTLLPAVVAVAAVAGTLMLPALARRVSGARHHRRLAGIAGPIGDGVASAVQVLREHDWRLLGAFGYWLFDDLAMYASLRAFGSHVSFWAVAIAYLVGMLANSIPTPGGFVAVEGGLVGMLLLFKAHPAGLVLAAILTYRAMALWIPSIIGSLAFLGLRHEIGRPIESQTG